MTSHLTVTGVLAIAQLLDRADRRLLEARLHFFSLFVPHGTPLVMIPLIFLVELLSFLVRPFSLGLRLFVAMTAGHILLKVLAGFVINGLNAGPGIAAIVCMPSFVLMIGITAARAAGVRDPGLCVRAADVAVPQRRDQPSLSSHQPFQSISQGSLSWTQKPQS